jgi:hypothetical protein
MCDIKFWEFFLPLECNLRSDLYVFCFFVGFFTKFEIFDPLDWLPDWRVVILRNLHHSHWYLRKVIKYRLHVLTLDREVKSASRQFHFSLSDIPPAERISDERSHRSQSVRWLDQIRAASSIEYTKTVATTVYVAFALHIRNNRWGENKP